MTISDVLEELVDHTMHEFEQPQKIERWKRIGYLMYCNGGSMQVGGWGTTSYGGGIFKSGLSQNEAFELMDLSGIINGASMYDDAFKKIYIPKINEWLKSLVDEYNKQNNIVETETTEK